MRMRFPICLVSVLMLALNMALAQSKAASVLIPLKVVAPPQLSVAPVFIAAEEGYFADPARNEERIFRIVLEKLGQMQTNMPNLLVIHVQDEVAKSIDLAKLMQGIKNRADKRDASLYSHSRYSNPAEFYKDFLRLSAILFWEPNAQVWINKQAKVGLNEKVMKLVRSVAMKE